jgi:uncharacterized membrane protein
MEMSWWGTMVAVFLASAVEVVEMVTIVLAIGLTRGWRPTAAGVVTAAVVLGLLTALLGAALQRWIDVHVLQVIIGSLLLVFGLQWLRKAILRASGYKALHDEDALFRSEVAEARRVGAATDKLDWFAFTVVFKGVLLEGLEIVFIVMTIGASTGQPGVAAAAALAAVFVVGAAAAVLRHPLSRVPENQIKFAVGLLLTTFGTFWAGEGVGVEWLGEDLALLWLLAIYGLAAYLAVQALTRQRSLALVTG